MPAYYNELDPYAAQWLRNLIAAGHIAKGDVDERSIVDVRADDLRGYEQCHFFAGIGGWSYALRLAGWSDTRPIWTGSCPCQPFSAAGKGQSADDERHLWPAWFSLIRECRPAIIFGEQVEAAIGWGWLDLVFTDLEAEGYACGAAVLPACSVGAPHIRQRLWLVGQSNGAERAARDAEPIGNGARSERPAQSGPSGLVADTDEGQCGRLADGEGRQCNGTAAGRQQGDGGAQSGGATGLVGDAASDEQRRSWLPEAGGGRASAVRRSGPWSDIVWLPCTDGKARPTQPGLFPLAHGIPGRVGRLRVYGNAIIPALAAEFIIASQGEA